MPFDEIIRQLKEDPKAALKSPEIRAAEVFDAWIRCCFELTSANPLEGLGHVDTALVMASTTCQAVQCHGVAAAARRNLGELDRAMWLLEDAFRLSRGCVACEADLLRRRGLIHTSANREREALDDADAAVQAYLALEGPDHDLTGHGLADALLGRGDVRQYFGHVDLALGDFGEALALASPADHLFLYGYAQRALGTVLRAKGGYDNLLTANEHIREARKYFSGRKGKASRERAYLDWQTAMVRFELRQYPEGRKEVKQDPNKLRKMLIRSRNDFIEVRMPVETAAVASDQALLAFPQRSAVRQVMDEAYNLINARWPDIQPEVRRAFEPVRQAMVAVRRAAESDVTATSAEEIHSRMRATIERLREVCADVAGGQLLPCLLSWPSERYGQHQEYQQRPRFG